MKNNFLNLILISMLIAGCSDGQRTNGNGLGGIHITNPFDLSTLPPDASIEEPSSRQWVSPYGFTLRLPSELQSTSRLPTSNRLELHNQTMTKQLSLEVLYPEQGPLTEDQFEETRQYLEELYEQRIVRVDESEWQMAEFINLSQKPYQFIQLIFTPNLRLLLATATAESTEELQSLRRQLRDLKFDLESPRVARVQQSWVDGSQSNKKELKFQFDIPNEISEAPIEIRFHITEALNAESGEPAVGHWIKKRLIRSKGVYELRLDPWIYLETDKTYRIEEISLRDLSGNESRYSTSSSRLAYWLDEFPVNQEGVSRPAKPSSLSIIELLHPAPELEGQYQDQDQ